MIDYSTAKKSSFSISKFTSNIISIFFKIISILLRAIKLGMEMCLGEELWFPVFEGCRLLLFSLLTKAFSNSKNILEIIILFTKIFGVILIS